jgi:hypothetical protein
MKALMIVPMMIAGLVVVGGIFVLRLVGLVAAVAGGFGLLATLGAYAAYDHAPTAARWLALQQSGGFAAGCIAVMIVAWFGPVWLLQENDSRQLKR